MDLLSVSAAFLQLQLGMQPVHAVFEAKIFNWLCLPFDGAQKFSCLPD